MTRWANNRRYADLERDHARQELADDRERALTLPCEEPGCGATAGEICTNLRDGKPLTKQVVHGRRLIAGQALRRDGEGEHAGESDGQG